MTMLASWAWGSAALALLPLVMAWRNLRLFTVPQASPPVGTRVSILIPARDEERNILSTVQLALASTGVEIEVVVLDDHSSDRSADIVRRLAREDARVRLESAPALPPGWAGKQHACHVLAQRARFDVLMFVDADVQLSPGAAAHATALLLADARHGMVSGFPQQQTVSLAERLVVPWIHLLLLGYLPMQRMRRSTAPSYAAACGQWVIARREAYREVGGHGADPASRHDGLSLPRAFRARGWKTHIFDGTGLALCRMYRDLPSVWHGFGKSAGEGMASAHAYPLWLLLIGAGHVLPWLLLVLGLATGDPRASLAAAVGVLANITLRLLLRRRFKQAWSGALLHPIGATMVLAINAAAWARHLLGRQSTWRGRAYRRR
jgi:glycosyltransferase involved in cell wall biosynthesis